MKYTKIAQQLGSRGGKASAKSRFEGMTKEDISEYMSKVRLTHKEEKEFDEMVDEAVNSLNKSATQEQND